METFIYLVVLDKELRALDEGFCSFLLVIVIGPEVVNGSLEVVDGFIEVFLLHEDLTEVLVDYSDLNGVLAELVLCEFPDRSEILDGSLVVLLLHVDL